MSKQRSRRLRKKLRVGEFQEFGFSTRVQFKRTLNSDEAERFVDALLAEAIECRRLVYGGWADEGFVAREGRGSVTEEDRNAVLAWLRSRDEVSEAQASPLMDAWHGTDLDYEF